MTWDNVLSGIAGGIIGGLCSVAAVLVQNCLARKNQTAAEQQILDGFLNAVRNEIETLWNRYDEAIGKNLVALMPGQPFLVYYPLFQDYFTVYTTHAFLLGRVKDHELRALIVKTYAMAKGFADSFRFNNVLLEKFENATWLYKQTQIVAYQQNANALHQSLAHYATVLKSRHNELKDHVDRLLRLIDAQK